jgi:hypothetical protein
MEHKEMDSEISDNNDKKTPPSVSDWENRVLCSDGNCIGVIGADGRCKECGKKFDGQLPEESAIEVEEAPPEEEVIEEAVESTKIDDSPADDDWENRILCSDGNCIGVIGADGRCKECGKPSES